MHFPRILRSVLSALLLCGLVSSVPAAEALPDATQKARDAELKQKTDEIERLKRDLEAREAELKRLQKDNEKLRQDQAAPPKPAAAPTTAPAAISAPAVAVAPAPVASPAPAAQPSRPLSAVPPIAEDQTFDARDLALYYKADPAAADQRFKGRTFRISGMVDRFHPGWFNRNYTVFLDSFERSMDLSFLFGYRPEWKTVVTDEKGRELVATMDRQRITLLKIGQPLVIQATCKGLDGEVIEFSRSRIVP